MRRVYGVGTLLLFGFAVIGFFTYNMVGAAPGDRTASVVYSAAAATPLPTVTPMDPPLTAQMPMETPTPAPTPATTPSPVEAPSPVPSPTMKN